MLNITDVCERLGVSRDTVLSWIGQGQMSAVDVAPAKSTRKMYRIAEQDLQAFLASRAIGKHKTAALTKRPNKILQFV